MSFGILEEKFKIYKLFFVKCFERFGKDENERIIVRMKTPGQETRAITYHYVLRLLEDEEYESLNYAGLDGLIDGSSKTYPNLDTLLRYIFFNFSRIRTLSALSEYSLFSK